MLTACFPAGTLSGAPKPRAMQIIDELEPSRRGLYGGCVGYLDFAGDSDTAIAIRTALLRDGTAYVQAGAGIVADSDPGRRGHRVPQQGGRGAARRAHGQPDARRLTTVGDSGERDCPQCHRPEPKPGPPPRRATAAARDRPPQPRRRAAVRRRRRGRGPALLRQELGRRARDRARRLLPLTAEGSDVTGVPAALAIVGLAALVAVFAVRRAGRTLVAALLALSGAGAVVAAVLGAGDSAALDEKAAEVSGNTAATIGSLGHTAWPYVAAAGGALHPAGRPARPALRPPLAGDVRPLRARRHARGPAGGPRAVDPDRPEELWKALDRGEDPTREA